LVAYAIKLFLQFKSIEPVAIFDFEDATNEFAIHSTGYYSISVLGAGSIYETGKIAMRLVVNEDEILDVRASPIATRFRRDGEIGVECWGFSTDSVGPCVLTIANSESVEAKDSMLISKGMFQSPINHRKLKLLIYENIRPLFKVLAVVSLVVGVNLIVIGIAES